MKAVSIHKNGDSNVLQLQEIPQPVPHAGEALVHIKACGLNLIDIFMRDGTRRVPLPFTPGIEGAGIVEAVGTGVNKVKPGDRVVYAGQLGSYAEYNIVNESKLILLPKEITFEEAAASLMYGMAAHYFIHKYYFIRQGDHVLIQAADGGVSLLLIQWLKHKGAYVIGCVATQRKAKIVLESGADQVTFYSNLDKLEDVDYVIGDVLQKPVIEKCELIQLQEYFSTISKSNRSIEHDIKSNSSQINKTNEDSANGHIIIPNKKMSCAIDTLNGMRAYDVLNGLCEKWLNVRIHRVLPLEQADLAQRLLADRETVGKIILRI